MTTQKLYPAEYYVKRQRVMDDIEELRIRWRIWQARYQYWQSFAFPGNPIAGVMSSLGTIFQTENAQALEEKRSNYLSEWVGTRGDTLTWRRAASKTNILPNTYGTADDEQLIELGHGIFNNLNRQKMRGVGGFSWDYCLKMMGTWTGVEAFMVRLYDGGVKGACVDAPFIDPYNLYHDIDVGPEQMLRIVREFTVKWADVPGKVKEWTKGRDDANAPPLKPKDKPDSALANVADYWRRDPDGTITHAMFIDDSPDTDKRRWNPIRDSIEWIDHGYTSLPIVIATRPAANHNFQDIRHSQFSSTDAQVYYHAEPFYARAINLLIFLHGLESLAADGAALAALPIFLSRDGETRKEDIKPFAFLKMATDEQLTVLQNIQNGQITVDNAIARLYRQLDSVYPDYLVTPGAEGGESSGYKYSLGISQAKMYMVPWSQMDEAAKYQLLASVIDQHKNIYPELDFHLSGILSSGDRFSRKFKSSDYPKGEFEIDIQEPAEIPGEELQNQSMAMQATQGVKPLVSVWRARITKLGISDPMKEQERIDDETFHMSPANQNFEQLTRLGTKIDELQKVAASKTGGKAERYAAFLAYKQGERYLAGLEMQLSGAPNTGYTDKPQAGNPQNMALASQQTTSDPNMAALAEGVSPTGTEGRPRPAGAK